ncbi:MAG: tyrosine-type recombinase/integrase [Synergistaceae bacterium]|nr:tyrosine-type recombinase/integrase [Synergistaceae bacterium]
MITTISQNKSVLFASIADSWKQKIKNSGLSSTTIKTYESVLEKKIMPKFRNCQVSDISRQDCEELIADYRNKSMSNDSLRIIWTVITDILKSAYDENLFPEKIKWPFPKGLDKPEIIPESSLDKLEKAIHENDSCALMSVMLRENIPMLKLLALSKDDVKEDSCTIRIKNKMSLLKNNFSIKLERNIQEIKISKESMAIIKNEILKHIALEKKSQTGKIFYDNPCGLIFAGTDGTIPKPSYYVCKFSQLSQRVGFQITPKTLVEFNYVKKIPVSYSRKVVKSKGRTYNYLRTYAKTNVGRREICARSVEELNMKYKMRNNRYAYKLTKNETLFADHCRKELAEKNYLSEKEKEKIAYLIQKYLDPFSANFTVNQIDDDFQGNFIKYLDSQKCSFRTREQITRFLSKICTDAMNKNYIRYNPFADVYLTPDKPVKYKALSEDEIKKIMQLDNGNINNAFLQVKLLTGLRTAEALGLRWEDISKDKKHIFVHSQLSSKSAGNVPILINKTKNYKSRTITPPSVTFEILDKYRARTGRNPQNTMNLVFCNENGTPLNAGLLHKKLKDIVGRKNVRLHDLRVTAITVIYKKTGDLALAAKEAGHSNTTVTAKNYVDVEPDLSAAKTSQDQFYTEINKLQQ